MSAWRGRCLLAQTPDVVVVDGVSVDVMRGSTWIDNRRSAGTVSIRAGPRSAKHAIGNRTSARFDGIALALATSEPARIGFQRNLVTLNSIGRFKDEQHQEEHQ